MKDLLKEIQKLLPGGTPRRILYPGLPESPTNTLYEVIGGGGTGSVLSGGRGAQSASRNFPATGIRKSSGTREEPCSGTAPLLPGSTEEYRTVGQVRTGTITESMLG